MSKKLPILFLLFLSFAWFACKKVDVQFGDEFIDNGYTQIIKTDSFTADISTVLVDSFVTSGKGVSLIGGYTDPYFGQVSVKNYFDLAPPTLPVVADSFATATFDSIALLVLPDKSYYGDTSKTVHVDVHRVNQAITGYESNLSIIHNTQTFSVDAAPIGSKDFKVLPLRSDSVKIRLNDAFGRALLTKLKTPNDPDLQSTTFFLEYLKGLRLSSPANSPVIFGAKDSIVMRLYYKLPGLFLQNKSFDFKMANKSHHFNNITVDRSATVLKNLATVRQLPSSATGNMSFSSYITGAMVKIRFPSVRDVLKLNHFAKILKATLVVRPIRGSYTPSIDLPPLLRLSSTTQLNLIGDDLAYVVNGTASAQTGSLVVDYLYGENTNYAYDVTAYVKALTQEGTINNNGLLLIPPSPALETRFNRIVIGDKNNNQGKTELLIVYAAVQ